MTCPVGQVRMTTFSCCRNCFACSRYTNGQCKQFYLGSTVNIPAARVPLRLSRVTTCTLKAHGCCYWFLPPLARGCALRFLMGRPKMQAGNERVHEIWKGAIKMLDDCKTSCVKNAQDHSGPAQSEQLIVAQGRNLFDRHFGSILGFISDWPSQLYVPGSARKRPSDGLCAIVLELGVPLVICDAVFHPLLRYHEELGRGDIGAFLGVPVSSPDGMAHAVLFRAEPRMRYWTKPEVNDLVQAANRLETLLRKLDRTTASR